MAENLPPQPHLTNAQLSEMVYQHSAKIDKIIEEVEKTSIGIQAISNPAIQQNQPSGPTMEASASSNRPSSSTDRGKNHPKIELSKYDGEEDSSAWVLQVEQYFLFFQVPVHEQLILASFHLKNDALQYFKWMQQSGALTDWPTFPRALETRFGPTELEDPEGELAKLRQRTSVKEYQKEFEKLSNRVTGISDKFLLQCYISGLKDEIRLMVKSLRPTTLLDAMALARTQESVIVARNKQITSWRPLPQPAAKVDQTNTPTIKRVSYEEMKERREQGLCYHCDENFKPGHRCKARTLFLMDHEEEDEADIPKETLEETNGEISLHAMAGARTPQTLRVIGIIANRPFYILIDSGSTHNFLDPHIFKRTGMVADKGAKMKVTVANGEQMQSMGRCKDVRFTIQGIPLSCDFFLLPLGGYDAVLGTCWLRTLGPIKLYFSD